MTTTHLSVPTYEEEQLDIFISPPPNAVQYQKGYLGARGERAAIEGEVQVKGARPGYWQSVFVTLQTVEEDFEHSIEISSRKVMLFPSASTSRESTAADVMPSTLPFSIPLLPDTPQCIHTAHSSIKHILSATLQPLDLTHQVLSKRILVHPRRYASSSRAGHSDPLHIDFDEPIKFQIETSRTVFHLDDPIPIYATIPPPEFETIRARGLQLRSVVAELVRVVSMGESQMSSPELTPTLEAESSSSQPANCPEKADNTFEPSVLPQEYAIPNGLRSTIIRTGASCRLNATRAIKLRLLLVHANTPKNYDLIDPETVDEEFFDCATITQSTVLHDVSFFIAVTITFMYANSHSESKKTIHIPITLLPNVAPFPEVDESFTSAYSKKHDRPPAWTVRHEEADVYQSGAGPSMSGAPPPFDERDAPPPFSVSASHPTPSHLPTFLEAESDMNGHLPILPPNDSTGYEQYVHVTGEGSEFGFIPQDQFDGLSASFAGLDSPPPSINNLDDNVHDYANLILQPDQHSLAVQLGSETELTTTESLPPPPPPPMDDPSDPPPSIYEEQFRRSIPQGHTPPPIHSPMMGVLPAAETSLTDAQDHAHSSGNAPPPYLHPPGTPHQEETVMRPPPYVD